MEARVPLPTEGRRKRPLSSEERRSADQWYVCEDCGMKLRRGLLSAIWHRCPGCQARMVLAQAGQRGGAIS